MDTTIKPDFQKNADSAIVLFEVKVQRSKSKQNGVFVEVVIFFAPYQRSNEMEGIVCWHFKHCDKNQWKSRGGGRARLAWGIGKPASYCRSTVFT